MAVKFIDLRVYRSEIGLARHLVTAAATLAGFEVVITGRDSLMLHGDKDKLDTFFFMSGGPDLPVLPYDRDQKADPDDSL